MRHGPFPSRSAILHDLLFSSIVASAAFKLVALVVPSFNAHILFLRLLASTHFISVFFLPLRHSIIPSCPMVTSNPPSSVAIINVFPPPASLLATSLVKSAPSLARAQHPVMATMTVTMTTTTIARKE
jgi:hypothetical protein